ncbi:hypothetical protein GF420_01115 [candidate division GN15 bacterium]|nr:hypothetical protein [candidate division GN15 bacterium]
MLNLFSVVMLMLTAGYLIMTFSHILSAAVEVTVLAGAAGCGFGYARTVSTVSAQEPSE